MKSRVHKIRRSEIKRRMRRLHRAVDRRWDALFSMLGAGIALTSAGIHMFFTSKPGFRFFSIIVFFLGMLFFAFYKSLLRIFKDQYYISEWLNPADHIIVVLFFIVGFILQTAFNAKISLAIYFAACLYATWRLRKYSRPYLRAVYFRVAREYLWEISPDNPNNSAKRDAPQAARPLP